MEYNFEYSRQVIKEHLREEHLRETQDFLEKREKVVKMGS